MKHTSYRASQVKRKEAIWSCNFTFHYIDDVLSLTNCNFSDFVDRIYSFDLEIKDTTNTAMFASYLDLHLKIDKGARVAQ